MITNYRRARQDATFLIEWAETCNVPPLIKRYVEALYVMNSHDSLRLIAMILMSGGGNFPLLPDHIVESDGIPETGA